MKSSNVLISSSSSILTFLFLVGIIEFHRTSRAAQLRPNVRPPWQPSPLHHMRGRNYPIQKQQRFYPNYLRTREISNLQSNYLDSMKKERRQHRQMNPLLPQTSHRTLNYKIKPWGPVQKPFRHHFPKTTTPDDNVAFKEAIAENSMMAFQPERHRNRKWKSRANRKRKPGTSNFHGMSSFGSYKLGRGNRMQNKLRNSGTYTEEDFINNNIQIDPLPVIKVNLDPMGEHFEGAMEFDEFLGDNESYEHDEVIRDEDPYRYEPEETFDPHEENYHDPGQSFLMKPNPLGDHFTHPGQPHHQGHFRPHKPQRPKRIKRPPIIHRPHHSGHVLSGCRSDDGIFRSPGESWPHRYSCGRSTCTKSLKSGFEIWEERCDQGMIQNPQYACVIEANPRLPYPDCCPRPTQCRDEI